MQPDCNNCIELYNNSCNDPIKVDEIDIESLFITNSSGYIHIWKNIFNSIASQDITAAFEHIYAANRQRFQMPNKYVLSMPPSDHEKFLYLNSGSFTFLFVFVSSISSSSEV